MNFWEVVTKVKSIVLTWWSSCRSNGKNHPESGLDCDATIWKVILKHNSLKGSSSLYKWFTFVSWMWKCEMSDQRKLGVSDEQWSIYNKNQLLLLQTARPLGIMQHFIGNVCECNILFIAINCSFSLIISIKEWLSCAWCQTQTWKAAESDWPQELQSQIRQITFLQRKKAST